MKTEEKDLLLKDLCGRLPYGVKCSFGVDDAVYEITGINPSACGASEIQATHVKSGINGDFKINSFRPYLFPLSSMTEEQKKEEYEICKYYLNGYESKLIDFYNKNHLDYRGLIPKRFAIDATNLNIY